MIPITSLPYVQHQDYLTLSNSLAHTLSTPYNFKLLQLYLHLYLLPHHLFHALHPERAAIQKLTLTPHPHLNHPQLTQCILGNFFNPLIPISSLPKPLQQQQQQLLLVTPTSLPIIATPITPHHLAHHARKNPKLLPQLLQTLHYPTTHPISLHLHSTTQHSTLCHALHALAPLHYPQLHPSQLLTSLSTLTTHHSLPTSSPPLQHTLPTTLHTTLRNAIQNSRRQQRQRKLIALNTQDREYAENMENTEDEEDEEEVE